VLACSGLGQLHSPGELFSYCNSGFVIAGRIIEKLRGMTWDAALKKHLLEPIGADSMESLPERLLYYRAAIGHLPDPESGELGLPPEGFLSRSNGPAGATPYAAARDLLAFSRLHLNQGRGPDGSQILSADSAAAMQTVQRSLPAAHAASAWGLGFMLLDWSGERVIGHDGGTVGQNSFLRIVPERKLAVALLTNGGNNAALYRHVYNAVLGELAGIQLPALLEPTGVAIDSQRYVGTYERLAARLVVEERDGDLQLTITDRRPFVPGADQTTSTVSLEPVDASIFQYRAANSRFKNYASFEKFADDGRAAYLHLGGRTAPRIA